MAAPLPAESPDLLSLLRTGEVAPEIRRFAARGLLPLDQDGQLRALLAVLDDPDPETNETARATLAARSLDELARFLEKADPSSVEIDTLTRFCADGAVLERAVRHRNVDDQTLLRLARTSTGSPQDALVVNQVRLLRLPALIDALFENPDLTSESRRRLNETREEFFDKEDRRRHALEQRIQDAIEAEETARAAAEAGESAEVGGVASAEGEEAPSEEDQAISGGVLFRRIGVMTVQEKVNLAYSGGKEERRILIGDSNSLVGQAVLKSRGLTIAEIEAFCMMRHLDAEVFRKIAANREWIRKQAVMVALVKNPAVPIALSLPLIKHLSIRELKAVGRDPNLPEGVRLTAKKLLTEKQR